ncbi:MAG: sugar ABC transporter permease [Clostridiaceae bacterium]|nr:sugar ABC transporter permease [Clostridiaceae bacterium]
MSKLNPVNLPGITNKRSGKKTFQKIIRNYDLYIFLLPAVAYIIIFHYVPMYGVQIAFKEFIATKGILGSPWIGGEHFRRFFNSYQFWRLIKNTLGLSVYQLVAGFPLPIILALMLNSVNNNSFKKLVQTTTYAPYFISTVVLVSMMLIFLSPRSGLVNKIIELFGGTAINFMAKPKLFKTLYVLSGIWQNTGWNAIIYVAALSAIDPELHTAAIVDGASRFKRIIYIDLPGIAPTIIILLILNIGHIMSIGFEKVYLMQNDLNITSSEVISTYVYKVGLGGNSLYGLPNYGYSAAVGLFNSVINFAFLLVTNKLSKIFSETSLW